MAWAPASNPRTKAVDPADNPDELPDISLSALRAEPALRRALLAAWRDISARVDVDAVEAAVARNSELDIDRLLLPLAHADAVTAAIQPIVAQRYSGGAEFAFNDLRARGLPIQRAGVRIDFNLINRESVIYAQQIAAALVSRISTEQRAIIRTMLADAFRIGIAPRVLARLLQLTVGLLPRQVSAVMRFRADLIARAATNVGARVRKYATAQLRQRALTIARTELIAAANAGQQRLWVLAEQGGLLDTTVLKKHWIVTDDERLEEHCEAIGESDPIPINELFTDPIDGTKVAHPPRHPRCRCAMGLVYLPK